MSAVPFFKLNASYVIGGGADLEALLHDCTCLLDSGLGAIADADGACDRFTSAQWAGLYVLRQAAAVFSEIERRVLAGERVEGAAP